jgi:acetyl-CoA acetyltransferase
MSRTTAPVAAITGAAISQIGRRTGRSALDLTIEATQRALADAGLTAADIDGVSTYPGAGGKSFPGHNGNLIAELAHALDLKLEWFCGGGETAGQLGALFNAVGAIAAGLCDHVLVYRSLRESSAQTTEKRAGVIGSATGRIEGVYEWIAPFGALSPSNVAAMYAMRHFHEFGTTREQLAQVALTARRNAADTSYAVYRDPMTMADYLGARPISDPLCLFDCDVPIDGATVVIVSRKSLATSIRSDAITIESMGTALYGSAYWDQYADLTSMVAHDAASSMWARTSLTPADVDVAELYDGFSIFVPMWLEAFGFCGRGESGAFIEGGTRIAVDGELPINTGGGQLSGGRLHGYGLLYQACLQLWGTADRQVSGDPRVAVVGVGGGPLGGSVLLTKD